MKTSRIFQENQELMLLSLLLFSAGVITGCFGSGNLPSGEVVAKGFILPLPADPTALDYMANNIRVAFIAFLGGILEKDFHEQAAPMDEERKLKWWQVFWGTIRRPGRTYRETGGRAC